MSSQSKVAADPDDILSESTLREICLEHFDTCVYNDLPQYLIRISDMKLYSRDELWEIFRPLVDTMSIDVEEARRTMEKWGSGAVRLLCKVACLLLCFPSQKSDPLPRNISSAFSDSLYCHIDGGVESPRSGTCRAKSTVTGPVQRARATKNSAASARKQRSTVASTCGQIRAASIRRVARSWKKRSGRCIGGIRTPSYASSIWPGLPLSRTSEMSPGLRGDGLYRSF